MRGLCCLWADIRLLSQYRYGDIIVVLDLQLHRNRVAGLRQVYFVHAAISHSNFKEVLVLLRAKHRIQRHLLLVTALGVVDEYRAVEVVDHEVCRFYDHCGRANLAFLLGLPRGYDPFLDFEYLPLHSQAAEVVGIVIYSAIETDLVHVAGLSKHDGVGRCEQVLIIGVD